MKITRTNGVGGFTLVEIMIVIAIIALLRDCDSQPAPRRCRSQATACINNLRQIDTACSSLPSRPKNMWATLSSIPMI